MDTRELIDELRQATGPSKILDAKLAIVLGWTMKKQLSIDPETGAERYQYLWVVPSGDDANAAPVYTSTIDCARRFAEELCPGQRIACSWEPSTASAAVGPQFGIAENPALALCLAALLSQHEAKQLSAQ